MPDGVTYIVFLALRGALTVCFSVVAALSGVSACKRVSEKGEAVVLSAKSPDRLLLSEKLLERQNEIKRWVQRCGVSVAKENCEVGDAALFNGLMCLSGDELSCEGVRRSQGSDGRMWRAEYRIAADAVNSFSRDMSLGVLAYLVKTRDRELAVRWMNWIESNEFRLCRESSDNRCAFTPGFLSLFREVWQFIGLPVTAQMRAAVFDDSVMALIQARFAPAGFEMHLAGVNALIRKSMGQNTPTLNSLTDALMIRQPLNPFFSYLAMGARPQVVELALAWCPRGQPEERAEWSFERDEVNKPWQRSMGWECIMLINFLLRDLNS
ncbi:MAG: hypothetical protein RL189_3165 [Pseudomonadota bacterium]